MHLSILNCSDVKGGGGGGGLKLAEMPSLMEELAGDLIERLAMVLAKTHS